MTSIRLWKLLLVGMLATLLVACKPFASFEVTPEPVIAGQVATFDASGSSVAPTPRNNAVIAYTWDFGDGSSGTGQIATHTYAAAGTYTVKLSVRDKAGRVGKAVDQVVVQAADVGGNTVPLAVTVRGADGALLAGAQVTIGSASASTGNAGVATLAQAPAGNDQVLRVSKAGFITQVLSLDLLADTTAQEIGVQLLAVKETIAIAQAEAAQVLLAKTLGASVTLPANALVNAANAVATGPITLQLTPWDISGADLLAMPGNGEALDAQNNRVSLISAGMLSVDFLDAAGNKLQLGSGKSAEIQMDLASASINGQALAVDSSVPLWHFDEAQGLWVEEGVGVVVASTTSPTGLAIRATVSHFSTWNWDFKFENAGSVVVSCINAAAEPIACAVVANVTLPDGSHLVKSSTLGTTPTTIINMPSSGSIVWHASTSNGLQASATSGTSGTVVLTLSPPTTRNFVQCVLPGGAPVDCNVTLTGTLNGTETSLRFAVPAAGATIESGLAAGSPLQWTGESFRTTTNASVRNVGSTSSGASGAVSITLGADEAVSTRIARVQCDTLSEPAFGLPEAVAFCDLQIYVNDATSEQLLYTSSVRVRTGVNVNVPVPEGSFANVYASGTSANGFPLSAFANFDYAELLDNTLFVLRLRDQVPT
ncbi:MAG: hypothetical protein A3F78_22500 [Burkholderiales bacterium RIFCSPLOWO2_12_FULL_61_40]|nr:MAG: hypothetical protein A3F78_22500 [Burkholderiales bacterium RIFCSPLOWO2_12_FULL_61_40]